MTDRIIVENLKVTGRHGWRRFAEAYPQPFNVSASLELSLKRVAETDNLKDTIDYADVCQEIKKIVETESYAMIEKLASVLAEKMLEMGADATTVRVGKLGVALIHGAEKIAIEIHRTRAES